MIWIRGDTHGFVNEFLDIDRHMEEGDICIICGDCGLLFSNDDQERKFLDDLSTRPYTICFVDGNHENFPAIYAYPEEIWNGGKIHRIRKNVIHLCRGQVFTIEGKSFFTFGGGYSMDKMMRVDGKSWWKEEMPTREEYNEGKDNLEAHQWTVDYIITHTANIETVRVLRSYDRYRAVKPAMPEEAPLNFYLEEIRERTAYTHWYFGHFHLNREIGFTRQTVLLDQYVAIGGNDDEE